MARRKNNGVPKKNGRPRIIETPEEFDQRVDDYLATCKTEKEPITFTGMALHLGFVSRQSFYDYAQRDGFSEPVKRAQAIVEKSYERRLSGQNVAGAIFALKNHGWSDRVDHTHGGGEKPIELAAVTDVRERLYGRILGVAARLGTGTGAGGADGNGAGGA